MSLRLEESEKGTAGSKAKAVTFNLIDCSRGPARRRWCLPCVKHSLFSEHRAPEQQRGAESRGVQ